MQVRDITLWSTIAIGLILGFWLVEKATEPLEGEQEPESVAQREFKKTLESVSAAAFDTLRAELRPGREDLPNFGVIKDVKAKKQAFFDYLRPLIAAENLHVLGQRRDLLSLLGKQTLDSKQRRLIKKMAGQYRVNIAGVDWQQSLSELLKRVDTVPVSLALSQSANETAWGTSRFAREGNNLFGQWCFTQGCGLVPSGREEGASHEVAKFVNPQASVRSYILSLNRNQAYEAFRELRAKQRLEQVILTGAQLAPGLQLYSARGEAYIEELQAMIRINNLAKYDVI